MPGLSKYKYKLDVAGATGIQWSADKASAGFEGATNQLEAVVTFDNSAAAWIRLRVDFTLNGNPECAEKHVALVKVDVGVGTFGNPGRPSSAAAGVVCQVNPPAPPAAAAWVLRNHPGSAWAAFTYNGSQQAAEPGQRITSNGGGGGAAYTVQATVTLTSPPDKPTALKRIQVGYIQGPARAGSAKYATNPAGGSRTLTVPTPQGLDWLTSPAGPSATDEWPWYDQSARATGASDGAWNQVLSMSDSPGAFFPDRHDPNNAADPNSTAALTTGTASAAFTIRVAARTLDPDLDADTHYFDEAHSSWTVNFGWPLVVGVSLVTLGGPWTAPASPAEIDVDIVPSVINSNAPYSRWIPA